MTDRPTQLVGSLHGSLYLMLIAWLALLDRVTSVTLPYFFTYDSYNASSVIVEIRSQAILTNPTGPYHHLITTANGQVHRFRSARQNYTSWSVAEVYISSLNIVDYMCPTTDTT